VSPVRQPQPVLCAGAVLAGGAGRRLGGGKAGVVVGGRPLLDHALQALGRVARPVAVVVRTDTVLPPLPVPPPLVWTEDDGVRHPMAGVVHALERSVGSAVLVCAVDMPLMDPATLRVILAGAALAPEAAVVVPLAGGHLQVLCALYRTVALAGLRDFDPDVRAADLVSALRPAVIPFEDEIPFFNVNTPNDARRAEELLRARGG